MPIWLFLSSESIKLKFLAVPARNTSVHCTYCTNCTHYTHYKYFTVHSVHLKTLHFTHCIHCTVPTQFTDRNKLMKPVSREFFLVILVNKSMLFKSTLSWHDMSLLSWVWQNFGNAFADISPLPWLSEEKEGTCTIHQPGLGPAIYPLPLKKYSSTKIYISVGIELKLADDCLHCLEAGQAAVVSIRPPIRSILIKTT